MQITVGLSKAARPWYATALRAPARIEKRTQAEEQALNRALSDQVKAGRIIKDAFITAVDRLGDQVDVDQLTQLITTGRADQAVSIVDQATIAQGWAPVAQAISTAAVGAGVSAANAVNELGQLYISFGVTNPQTLEFLRTYEMSRIRGLTQDSLASVRLAIQQGIAAGRNPLDVARDVRAFIGLTETQTQAVLNYRSYLETLEPAALARALRDARLDPTIAAAIRDGEALDPAYIDKAVARYAARYLKYRSEVIARTEAIRAVSSGNHLLWKQQVADGKVRADQITRKWIYTHDLKTRPAHRLIPSMNPNGVGLNEPFQTIDGPLMYPGDPAGPPEAVINCRCSTFYRFKADPTDEG